MSSNLSSFNPSEEQNMEGLQLLLHTVCNPPPISDNWLRDDWSTTCFGPPFAHPTLSLDVQVVWACKKATAEIHRAKVTGYWKGVSHLTTALAIADRVLQLNMHARQCRCGQPPLLFNECFDNREADIKSTADLAFHDIGEETDFPTFDYIRHMSLFALARTYENWDSGQPFGLNGAPPYTDIYRVIREMDGGTLGDFQPSMKDLEAYGCTVHEFELGDETEDQLLAQVDKWAQENPDYREQLAKLPPSPFNSLPPGSLVARKPQTRSRTATSDHEYPRTNVSRP